MKNQAPYSILAVLLGLFLAVGPAAAQTSITGTITSISSSSSFSSSTSMNVAGAGTTSAPASLTSSNTYTVNYSGEVDTLNSFSVGSTTYAPITYTAGTVTTTLQRAGNAQTGSNNLLYSRVTSQSGNTINIAAPYIGNETTAFNTNNLNVGTDNLFGNTNDSNTDINNIERLDVVFSGGLTASNKLAFAVFERGASDQHDPFQIAAITSVDANGNANGWSTLVSITANSYGTTALSPSTSSTDWLVARNQDSANPPNNPAKNPSIVVNDQSIGGIAISVTGSTNNLGLGITSGTTIYGYSLFGADTQDGSDRQLQRIGNTTQYPQDTDAGTGAAGGLDLIAYTGVAFSAVPEPSVYGLLPVVFAGLIWLGRRGFGRTKIGSAIFG